jgi:hypothetical protein
LERLGIDLHTLPDLLQTFDDYTFASLDALEHDPLFADAFAELHGPNAHFVAAVDDRDQASAL